MVESSMLTWSPDRSPCGVIASITTADGPTLTTVPTCTTSEPVLSTYTWTGDDVNEGWDNRRRRSSRSALTVNGRTPRWSNTRTSGDSGVQHIAAHDLVGSDPTAARERPVVVDERHDHGVSRFCPDDRVELIVATVPLDVHHWTQVRLRLEELHDLSVPRERLLTPARSCLLVSERCASVADLLRGSWERAPSYVSRKHRCSRPNRQAALHWSMAWPLGAFAVPHRHERDESSPTTAMVPSISSQPPRRSSSVREDPPRGHRSAPSCAQGHS